MSAVLTEREIRECMARSLNNKLFVSPLLDATQIGDASIDLRIGQHFLLPKASKLGVIDVFELAHDRFSETQLASCYGRVRIPMGGYFTLHPGSQVHVTSLEYIGMPNDIHGDVTLRHSLASIPILAGIAKIQPGFRGAVTLNITNSGPVSIKLYPGIRFAQMELRWLASAIQSPRKSRYAAQTVPGSFQLHKDSDVKKLGPTVEPLIIGIASTIGAGRTTAITYLQERYGYILFRLSDTLRSEALRRGIITQRPQLQSLGNTLRELNGNGYLAQYLRNSRQWLNTRNPFVVVDGFKHPEEVAEFNKQERFKLIGINASEEIRWERVNARRRIDDPTTKKEFRRIDRADRGLTDGLSEHSQQIDAVLNQIEPQNIIYNNGTIEQLFKELDKLVNSIRQQWR